MDNLPPDQPTSQTPAPNTQKAPAPVTPVTHGRPWYRSKKGVTLAVILLILLGILSFVPGGKLPFLRHLMYAMGYSYEEGQKMSLLKGLLSWNEHSKIMRGELPDPNEISVFGAAGGALSSADKAQNKLIDINSVNAALAKRGQKGDYLQGSYNDPIYNSARANGEKTDASVRVQKQDVSANTQANNAQNADVYFGEDPSAIQRDKNDAFNSVDTLKKVANKPVEGFSGSTWLDRVIDKAVRSDTDLSTLANTIDRSGTTLAQLGNVAKAGDTKAKRDMYWAWLMGRIARRTPQTLLKKTLASTSFDGAELPRSVFTTSGFSGVGINPDDVVADMDSVQKYLDQDKDCQEALNRGMSAAGNENLGEKIGRLNKSSFPATCSDIGGDNDTYMGTLQSIESSCSRMKSAYEQVQRGCATISLELSDDQCESTTLRSYYTEFKATCNQILAKCEEQSGGDPAALQACRDNKWATRSSSETYGSNFNSDKLEGDRDKIFYEKGDSEGRLNTRFFPGVDWGGSLWVDSHAAD